MHAETRTHTDRLTHTYVNVHHTKRAHTQSHVSVLTCTCTHPHLHTYTYSGDTCIHHPLMHIHTNAMWARAHTFLRTCTCPGWQAGPWTEISLGHASMLAPRWRGWASSAPSRPVFPLCCLRKRSSWFSPVHSVCSLEGRAAAGMGSPRAVPSLQGPSPGKGAGASAHSCTPRGGCPHPGLGGVICSRSHSLLGPMFYLLF